jgi:type IV pilus assembly protein PilA
MTRPIERRSWQQRGFTLVELMIAVAMIGVLSALALMGYRKYIHSAQSNEARAVIGMIRGGQEAYKAEFLVYLAPYQSALALGSYYPNKTPNDARTAWNTTDARYTDPTSGWGLLNVSPDGPVRFGYACVAGLGGAMPAPTALTPAPTMPTISAGVPWYVIQAVNDHNANGIYAVFASVSTSGEIMSQAEWE